jgi:hypothetical protein
LSRDGTPDPTQIFIRLASGCRLCRFAVACADLAGGHKGSPHADEPFHPANTVKLAIMEEAYLAAEGGRLHLEDHLVDGSIYGLDPDDDSDPGFYASVGEPRSVHDRLEHIIVRGSNLAANVLLEPLGAEQASASMASLGARGSSSGAGCRTCAPMPWGRTTPPRHEPCARCCFGWHPARSPRRRRATRCLT